MVIKKQVKTIKICSMNTSNFLFLRKKIVFYFLIVKHVIYLFIFLNFGE